MVKWKGGRTNKPPTGASSRMWRKIRRVRRPYRADWYTGPNSLVREPHTGISKETSSALSGSM
jgi:hypothetical protein